MKGHEYPDLQVGDEVNPRMFLGFVEYCGGGLVKLDILRQCSLLHHHGIQQYTPVRSHICSFVRQLCAPFILLSIW